MSKLQQLIKELCPNGVEYKELGEYVDYVQPQKYIVKSTDYSDNYKTPVLTPGQTFILGYTDEEDGIYDASKDNPIILFDDFTTSKHWVDFKFKVKSSALKILVPKEREINFRYIYHMMMEIKFDKGEHGRKWISKYSKIPIPIPPLEVQEEIVKILDNFTNLTAELTAELTARKKQYEYYRDDLLIFKEGIKNLKLNEVCEIKRGKRVTKRDLINLGKYPVVSGGVGYMGYLDNYNREAYTITIAQYGTAGYVGWQKVRFWANDVCFSVYPNKLVLKKYLYYFLLIKQQYLYEISNKKAVPYSISKDKILDIEIPVPSIEVQEEIIKKLDMFDKLVDDLSEGLPAEIEMRQKQYEYYRKKLLTFKEL